MSWGQVEQGGFTSGRRGVRRPPGRSLETDQPEQAQQPVKVDIATQHLMTMNVAFFWEMSIYIITVPICIVCIAIKVL
ncbi:hypothetical protein WH95_04305 [Kiloniella litopenaei]|uniref:Uncharacterized protein n=1 Tax=Kiloniella litopenaei TaxID=1549748 RepID=A0A0M2RDR2_9PROT|nr:hypothetical protein WH95_04305 [Kiloniella litopenaei]